ncbi:hypothetical protein BC833DRAFT_387055 [Globomyces pollinis-pini]|nr:hypothetical protein BC833DRAFT_387055 [Globomyces pollinis-pini]
MVNALIFPFTLMVELSAFYIPVQLPMNDSIIIQGFVHWRRQQTKEPWKERQKCNDHTRDRTWNLLIRSQTP